MMSFTGPAVKWAGKPKPKPTRVGACRITVQQISAEPGQRTLISWELRARFAKHPQDSNMAANRGTYPYSLSNTTLTILFSLLSKKTSFSLIVNTVSKKKNPFEPLSFVRPIKVEEPPAPNFV